MLERDGSILYLPLAIQSLLEVASEFSEGLFLVDGPPKSMGTYKSDLSSSSGRATIHSSMRRIVSRQAPSSTAKVNFRLEYQTETHEPQDVHSGIYSIFSFNLTSKRTATLVDANPGGASRPELSRDGRTLAFVRRFRASEVLVLK